MGQLCFFSGKVVVLKFGFLLVSMVFSRWLGTSSESFHIALLHFPSNSSIFFLLEMILYFQGKQCRILGLYLDSWPWYASIDEALTHAPRCLIRELSCLWCHYRWYFKFIENLQRIQIFDTQIFPKIPHSISHGNLITCFTHVIEVRLFMVNRNGQLHLLVGFTHPGELCKNPFVV